MLLTLDPDGVKRLIERYEKDVKDIRKSCLQMSWHLRGGATYEDVLNMSTEEREIINSIIEQHMETTKQSGLPYF
jgi:hypothetical protein